MKKLLFVISDLKIGGGERSLVNLLNLFDFGKYQVDLLLFKREGILIKQIPKEVNIIQTPRTLWYAFNRADINSFKHFDTVFAVIVRLFGTGVTRAIFRNNINQSKQYRWHWFYKYVIKKMESSYEAVVAYMNNESMYYIAEKITCKNKIAWIHSDYNSLKYDRWVDKQYFGNFKYIVSISDECVNVLKENFPEFINKFICIPNLTASSVIKRMALEYEPLEYDKSKCIILSVGRLAPEKGYDLGIAAAKILLEKGYQFKWYIVGAGQLEKELNTLVHRNKLGDVVQFLGAKINPYPYIQHCDIFLQPSRCEGKSVVIDEAKILAKPIVVTRYRTIVDQIIDGEEGIIAELTIESIADCLGMMMNNTILRANLSGTLAQREYGNSENIKMHYSLM
ncbi:MAG TPA: glycosyltransferase [Firmicutes bacterium]|jgi:glycosyltransferase involved in cell wall biosynthesis|nr:glycosyltransferase [Bacillota bacterium]